MTFLSKFWKKARVYYTLSISGGGGGGPAPLDSPLILQRFYFIIHVVALVVAFVKVLWIMDGIEHYNSGSFV